MRNLFPIQTLDGVRYRLGVIPENNPVLEQNKQRVCLDIVNFYLKKVNLITNIQKELPNCREMERNVYDNLTAKLRSKGLTDDEWLAVYNRLENFNKEIKERYSLFEREMERVRRATTMKELDTIAVTTNSILAKTNNICKNYEHELIQFSNKAERYSPRAASPRVQAVSPRAFSPRAFSPRVQQRQVQAPVSPRVQQRQVQAPTSPRVQQRPVQQRAQMILPGEVQKTTLPSVQVYSPSRIPPVAQSVSPISLSPVTSPTFSRALPPKEKEELVYVPVEEIPEPSRRYTREIKVKADKITRTPEGLVFVQNPSQIKVVENIPKEYGRNFRSGFLPQGGKTEIEHVYEKDRKTAGKPVRAVDDYIPKTPGEVSLKKNQSVLYLGTAENGWSKIQHHSGVTGYVPHLYLSKN